MPELGWRDAIAAVLRANPEPMNYNDIAAAVIDRKLKTKVGATPAASVAAALSVSIRDEGDRSPFDKRGRGLYGLRGAAAPHVAEPEHVAASDVLRPDPSEPDETGFINAFGMFWRRDWIVWTASTPRLLGQQQVGSDSVDFCPQRGVYLLYDGSRAVYVGRTTDQALGIRLRQHTADRLNGRWDRFSWFGVLQVGEDGKLSSNPPETFTVDTLIATMEALLIEGLESPLNRRRGDGFSAVEFLQKEDPSIRKRQAEAILDDLKKRLP